MRRMIALSIACLAAQAAMAEEFHLICIGGGTANKQRASSATAKDSDGKQIEVDANTTYAEPFQDQADIEVVAGVARIRLPRALLPVLHGGNGGWMPIQGLQIDDRSLSGSVGLNFLNKPKIHIDRMTGTVSIQGMSGSFVGQCKPYDPATARRVF
jgi:hypothetical protein